MSNSLFIPADLVELTLPELQWLGRIIRAGELFWHLTWCEQRLYEKGLIARWEYRKQDRDKRPYGRAWHAHTPTELGRAVYGLARQRWSAGRCATRDGKSRDQDLPVGLENFPKRPSPRAPGEGRPRGKPLGKLP